LQNHIAWQTLRSVKPRTAPSEEEFKQRHPIVRVEAVENYVRGLMAQNVEAKIGFFSQAARLDPRFTQPCFQLGRLQFQKKNYKAAAEWFEKVGSTDAHFREATFLRGVSRFYVADYAGAQAAFERVVQEVPLNEVFNNLGAAQARLGLPQAAENFRKAIEGDNSDPLYHFNLGYTLWRQEKFDEAAESFRGALERDPNDNKASQMLERCLARAGPRPSEPRTEGMERLKHNYQEAAYWQLRALLEGGKR
jgi:tetratricopeptide (TPR) repeat protein